MCSRANLSCASRKMPRSPCLANKAPCYSRIPLEEHGISLLESGIQFLQSGIHSVESTIQGSYHMKVGSDPPGVILFQFYGSWLGTVKIFEPDKYEKIYENTASLTKMR